MPRDIDITNFKVKYRERNEGDFPDEMLINLRKLWNLRYGENPGQQGVMYLVNGINAKILSDVLDLKSVRTDSLGKGGLSLTNMMDITRAIDVLKYFDVPAWAIMKHVLLSGFAKQTKDSQSTTDLFRLARDSDLLSNFGGVAVTNRVLTMDNAKALYELRGEDLFFVDVVAAPGYEEGVIDYIQSQSKTIRIAQFSGMERLPKFQGDDTLGLFSIKEMPGGIVGVQDIYLTSVKTKDDLIVKPYLVKDSVKLQVEREPTEQEKDDLLTSWWINISGARSNGIVGVRRGVSIAMGSGQVSRVDAVTYAIIKGMQKAMQKEGIRFDALHGVSGYDRLKDNPFEGSAFSSDGFFPFGDSLELLAKVGCRAVIEPFGSVRDDNVIDTANKLGIALVATGERAFGHW